MLLDWISKILNACGSEAFQNELAQHRNDSVVYSSTKTYTHNEGLSVCFRQWRAQSHCRFIHGYAIQVAVEFGADRLDHRNWVIDFGGLKDFKGWLHDTFDHKLVVAADDPCKHQLEALGSLYNGTPTREMVADINIVPDVGCEAFAKQIFDWLDNWLRTERHAPRVWVQSVEVREHSGNSAIVRRRK